MAVIGSPTESQPVEQVARILNGQNTNQQNTKENTPQLPKWLGLSLLAQQALMAEVTARTQLVAERGTALNWPGLGGPPSDDLGSPPLVDAQRHCSWMTPRMQLTLLWSPHDNLHSSCEQGVNRIRGFQDSLASSRINIPGRRHVLLDLIPSQRFDLDFSLEDSEFGIRLVGALFRRFGIQLGHRRLARGVAFLVPCVALRTRLPSRRDVRPTCSHSRAPRTASRERSTSRERNPAITSQ